MLPERPFTKREAARVGLGGLVFGVAFAFAATLPDRLHLPYLEPFVGLVALALLVGAALAGTTRRVQVGYRRSVLVLFGLVAGWWTLVAWRPATQPLALLVPLAWVGLATAESARGPSLPWALGIASAPGVGVTTWALRSEADRHGSWSALARWIWVTDGLPGRIVEETVAMVLLLGVAPGVVAYLVGRWWHGADGGRPELRRPDDRTVALAAVALLSALLGLRLLLG